MKIGIIIVAVNCLEYSQKTIESINTEHEYELIFIDNGSTDGTKEWLKDQSFIHYIDPEVTSLSACWNIGINRAIAEGCELFLVLNNDIVLAKSTINNLVKKIQSGDYVMTTGVNDQSISPEEMKETTFEYDENEGFNEHPDFSCFLINKKHLENVGYFDENYHVAYFEDNDMHARIALSGEIATSTLSARYYHYGSKTVEKNEWMQSFIHDVFRRNKAYFARKWGCDPVNDVPEMRDVYFEHPFDQKDRDIKNTEDYFSIDELWKK